MRNWTRCSGVYNNMLRLPLVLACSFAAVAQPAPQQDPLDSAIQEVWQAGSNGRFQEVAAAREKARALLQRVPVNSPQFANWVQQVAQLYRSASWNAQARSILQEALARTAPLGESHPAHIAMLSSLGEFWWQDGNLLKAVGLLERAAAAPAQPFMQGTAVFLNTPHSGRYFGGAYGGSAIYAYTRLADLYQQLGRPDAVAAIGAKIRTLASDDPSALARFYEQHGAFEDAAAIYRKLAEQSANPQAGVNAWQSLANLSARQQHYTDAIDSMQQAIVAAQSLYQSLSPNPTLWMRQNLAGYMRSAGLLDQADLVYQQLLEQSQGSPQESQILGNYAVYLADTKRGPQAESLLKEYLAGRPSLDPQQKMSVFFNLANVARRSGDSKSADAYQQAGQDMQSPQPPPAGQILIGEALRKAQTAANEHRLAEAYGLALNAIDTSAQAADGQQAEWNVPQIASSLAVQKEPAEAEQLLRRWLAVAENMAATTKQRLISATRSYADFLMGQPNRWDQVPAAIEQYRRVLTDAWGADSGNLVEPLRMKIKFESSHSQWPQVDASARELLELQESLSGNTSEPYLGDLQIAARTYEAAGDYARALPLRRRAITVADLLATADNDWRRSPARMDAALALAHLGQFDEAETLGEEAVAMQRTMRTPRVALTQQLEQIRRMKQDASIAALRGNK